MIEFIKLWWAEILFAIGGIIYLMGLISNKDWCNLCMAVLLYIFIFELIYYQYQSEKQYETYIAILEKIILEN